MLIQLMSMMVKYIDLYVTGFAFLQQPMELVLAESML